MLFIRKQKLKNKSAVDEYAFVAAHFHYNELLPVNWSFTNIFMSELSLESIWRFCEPAPNPAK